VKELILKTCTKCGKTKDVSEFYHQNGKPVADCKECRKRYVTEWLKRNPERQRQHRLKRNVSERGRAAFKRVNNRRYKEGYMREYAKNNKEKFEQYIEKRKHKKHTLTKHEWIACKHYFNNACAYCGMSEQLAIEHYGQRLHKEHVDHDGANDLSNCIPACRSCNSSKWESELTSWYPSKPFFSTERYELILTWLHQDWAKYKESSGTK